MCDEPHPLLVKSMLGHCVGGSIDDAYKVVEQLWALGYSPEDIIGNIFRVCKTYPMAEYLKLEFIKVRRAQLFSVYIHPIERASVYELRSEQLTFSPRLQPNKDPTFVSCRRSATPTCGWLKA